MENKELASNNLDFLVSAGKGVLGIIPIGGSLLSELIGNIIPNQRLDRITEYIKILDEKFQLIPINKINSLLDHPGFCDFIEEGFVQASRAITDERRRYIASIICNGINQDEVLLVESKMLLKILQELSDIEIIWLRRFKDPTVGGDKKFRNAHKSILSQARDYYDDSEKAFYKEAIQNSYKDHLERLNLIQSKIRIDRLSKMPEFDSKGNLKKGTVTLTVLGYLLLKEIGLMET